MMSLWSPGTQTDLIDYRELFFLLDPDECVLDRFDQILNPTYLHLLSDLVKDLIRKLNILPH